MFWLPISYFIKVKDPMKENKNTYYNILQHENALHRDVYIGFYCLSFTWWTAL